MFFLLICLYLRKGCQVVFYWYLQNLLKSKHQSINQNALKENEDKKSRAGCHRLLTSIFNHFKWLHRTVYLIANLQNCLPSALCLCGQSTWTESSTGSTILPRFVARAELASSTRTAEKMQLKCPNTYVLAGLRWALTKARFVVDIDCDDSFLISEWVMR